MSESQSMLQVYFQGPFWVGVFERREAGFLRVCKVTFGAQPRDEDIYYFLQTHFSSLRFSPPVAEMPKPEHRIAKRRLREARRALSAPGGARTKAQQALQLQHEAICTARKEQSQQRKTVQAAFRFQKKQQKKREKRRGH